MTAIVVVALIASLVCIVWKDHRAAYLYVYLPIVICIPAWPRWNIPGLPDPSFQQAAMLPIALAFLLRARYRFSLLDNLVFGFLIVTGISEFINSGYPDAQNLMFDVAVSGFFPYAVTKGLMTDPRTRIRFIKVFVLCTSLVIVTTLFELKFAYNPYRLVFDVFFPGQGSGWVTTFRYGLPRVAGPYGHAILAGIMFMIAIRFQCWLQVSKNWRFKLAEMQVGPFPRVKLARLLTFWTCLGLFLTWVRGPQLGALLAWMVFRVTRGKKPKLRLQQASVALAVMAVPATVWFFAWIAGGRAAATTAGQESAAYRKELLEKYALIVLHHGWFGWGQNGWPKLPSMPSIDNYYLLIGLMYGLPAVVLLLAIFITVCVRLFKAGVALGNENPTRSSLSFTLLSIFVGLAFSLGTVYLGESVFAVFFALLGLTEAFLIQGQTVVSAAGMRGRPVQISSMRFRRVIA